MSKRKIYLNLIVLSFLSLNSFLVFSQKVKNVPKAFKALSTEPETIFINNALNVPTVGGHMQGVQLVTINGREKILISGSSLKQAYIIQADLNSQKAEKLIILMEDPFRHAGGFQVSEPLLAVGIEDNIIKTKANVCFYNYRAKDLEMAKPIHVIERFGEAKTKTAGSTGIIALGSKYLVVVSNWDSRNWDFYEFDPEKNESGLIYSFEAPDNWANYQSINLIKDKEAIYAVGFYQKEDKGKADLILIRNQESHEYIMKQTLTKTFNTSTNVDFQTAAGLQVDKKGKLHIWATQRDASKEIAVNRFSQQ